MILTTSPSITQKEIAYVTDAITNGHGEHWGDYVRKFEKTFADYLGVKHAMSTSSCTGALHLSLMAAGIGRGDEVIVPDTSWIATASAVTYVGAQPVFADVDKETWCIDVLNMESHINHRTKAIIPVHLYGNPSNMDAIMEVAKIYNLKVIEDAAPAIGASVNGRKVGSFGDTACFSFQGAKTISTGEGGMVVTDSDEVYDKLKYYANHCRVGSDFEIRDIGFKYKMSNLQAAWGLAQIERVDELIAKKREIYSWYVENLKDIFGITLNKPLDENYQPIFWMTSIVLDKGGVTRDAVRQRLKEKGVDTRPFFPPMSGFRMFPSSGNITAKYIGEQGINLPSGHDLILEEVEYICECLKEIL